MVTATSLGERFSCDFTRLAQPAAMTRRAVESGPPETARISPRRSARPPNSAFASSSRSASSAMATLLFSIYRLLYPGGSMRIFAQHFAERCTGGFLLTQSGQRLAKPQQGFRRARGRLVFGRHGEEGFGGGAILLLLEKTFAEPILCLRRQAIARILAQETAEGVGGERIVFVQHIAVGEIVSVARRIARRQRGLHRAGCARIGGWWRR